MKNIIDEINLSYSMSDEIILNLNDKLDYDKNSVSARCCKVGGVYRVEVTETPDPHLNELLKVHEYGHIYHGHLEGSYKSVDKKLTNIIKNNYDKLTKEINESCGIDYADKLLDKITDDPMTNHMLHNVAMDLEVNSTVLDDDDINYISEASAKIISSELERMQNTEVKSENDKMKLCNRLSRMMNNYRMKGVHPSQFGFSEGLRYPDYLVKCIMNLPEVLKHFPSSSVKKVKLGDGGEGLKLDNLEELGSRMPKTIEEFEEMMNNLVQVEAPGNGNGTEGDSGSGGGQGSESDSDKDNDKGKSSGSSDGDEDDDNEDGKDGKSSGKDKGKNGNEFSDHETDDRNESDSEKSSNKNHGRGTGKSQNVRNYHVNNDPVSMALDSIIHDCKNKVIKRTFQRDFTYKYNRKILGNSGVLSASYRQKVSKDDNPTIVFFIDVSGSMNESLVDRCITTVRNRMKKIDQSLKYSIAAWDTQLEQLYKDIDCNSPIPKLSCMGGTELAGTFRYFRNNFSKDAIMVIISDFEDSLDDWAKEESVMSGYSMYGICYTDGNYYYGGTTGLMNSISKFKNLKVRVVNERDK